jgi:hypothetical protein
MTRIKKCMGPDWLSDPDRQKDLDLLRNFYWIHNEKMRTVILDLSPKKLKYRYMVANTKNRTDGATQGSGSGSFTTKSGSGSGSF